MEINHFISKGLSAGDKVRVTLTDGTVREGYFGGWFCLRGKTDWLEDKVFPVFHRPGKDGRHSMRALFSMGTWVDWQRIADVERLIIPYRHVGYYNNAEDCYNLGIRGAEAVLKAYRNNEGAFVHVDNDEPFTDVVPDHDTRILENGGYAVRFNFSPSSARKKDMAADGEDCGYYIDIFERIGKAE